MLGTIIHQRPTVAASMLVVSLSLNAVAGFWLWASSDDHLLLWSQGSRARDDLLPDQGTCHTGALTCKASFDCRCGELPIGSHFSGWHDERIWPWPRSYYPNSGFLPWTNSSLASLYDSSAFINDTLRNLSEFRAKVVLVVNVASSCPKAIHNARLLNRLLMSFPNRKDFNVFVFPSHSAYYHPNEHGPSRCARAFWRYHVPFYDYPIFDKVEMVCRHPRHPHTPLCRSMLGFATLASTPTVPCSMVGW